MSTQTGTPDDNARTFTGRENDATRLLYYRARYYDPAGGRFISEEPHRDRGRVEPLPVRNRKSRQLYRPNRAVLRSMLEKSKRYSRANRGATVGSQHLWTPVTQKHSPLRA